MIFNFRKPAALTTRTRELEIDGMIVPVELRRNARARRFILKIAKANKGIVLTLPRDGSETEAMDFAISQSHWIKSRLAAQPKIIPFAADMQVPLRGEMHTIEHLSDQRGTVWVKPREGFENFDEGNAVICVAGDERHLARRLRDWLKKQARLDLAQRVEIHADNLGHAPKRITIRDQTTRWGSCSSSGVLSFSWRLVLAPPFVLDYVAAHEVAHLEELNHGPQFWELVDMLLENRKPAQKWLRDHGSSLHIYGN